jgi:signal transduction histidine kinase
MAGTGVVETATEQPEQWAGRILASAAPLLEAVKRPTVTVESPMNGDVEALQDAVSRVQQLLSSPSADFGHDLLNLIGAIRGYAEMLYEDIELLHPALKSALPALLSAVESSQSTLDLSASALSCL